MRLSLIVSFALAASTLIAQPVITANGVLNASGYQTTLAPDTVFVIFGAAMGPASIATASAPDYPTILSGTSITFTPAAGGGAVSAKMIYSLAGQVAGLLPSSIVPGTYAVRVAYNGQSSAPQNVTVAARSFGIASANSAGNGTAQATVGNVNGGVSLTRFNGGSVNFNGLNWTLTPAHPLDTLVLWGTGGGADAANDTGGTSGDQTAAGNFIVNVSGRQITPLYSGTSAGYPGLWQVNFTLPSDIVLDCFATVQVTAGGQSGNSVTIPIAAPGQTSCTDPTVSPTILGKLDSGGNLVLGGFAVAKLDTGAAVPQETGSGSFLQFSTTEWIVLNSGPKFGSCRVFDRTYPAGGKDPGSPDAYLNAGSQLQLTGPNLPAGFTLNTVSTAVGPAYANSMSAGTLASGTYALTGTGGPQVGPFNTSTVFPAGFTVTNWTSITVIDRTKPLTLNWSGSGFDQVAVVIGSTVATSTSRHLVTITCMVPGSPGTYTVDNGALAYLSLVAASGTSFGTISLQGVKQGNFTANLASGTPIDLGIFSANLGVSKNIATE
ncbi:MAG TPA: hypothetical protein VGG72_07825 [Bryobacteraceae bacterium]|jgi:uncharacterized protein (TIGR03437 family)